MKEMMSGLKHLDKAILLHRGHMDGSVPTSEESQEELMEHLMEAKSAFSMPAMQGSHTEQGMRSGGKPMLREVSTARHARR